MKKIVIAHGLPGSGKSTLMKRQVADLIAKDMCASYVDLDVFHKQGYAKALREALYLTQREERDEHYDWSCFSEDTIVYLDALCISQLDVANLITETVARFCYGFRMTNFEFTILDFEEDRESCSKNDAIRKRIDPHRSASLTIKEARFEPINLERLNETVADLIANNKEIFMDCKVNLIVKKEKVWNQDEAGELEQIKSIVYGAANTIRRCNNNILCGDSWITGGHTWSYTGYECPVEGEAPNDFEQFDTLLEAVCPGITFLNYKKIRKQCCYINSYHESDYYESYDKSRWECDLDKLSEAILEANIKIE